MLYRNCPRYPEAPPTWTAEFESTCKPEMPGVARVLAISICIASAEEIPLAGVVTTNTLAEKPLTGGAKSA